MKNKNKCNSHLSSLQGTCYVCTYLRESGEITISRADSYLLCMATLKHFNRQWDPGACN